MDPMGIEPYDPYELDTLKAAKMPETPCLGLLSSLCLAFTGCGLFLFRCGLLSAFHEVPGTFDEEPAVGGLDRLNCMG